MSEQNNSGSAAPQENSQSQEQKNDFVSKKAYEEVTSDMHKYKNGIKEKEAKINELMAQLKAQEEAKLQENEQWQEIAKRREAELEELKTQYTQKSSSFENALKRTALKQELGGKIKEEYLQFANLSAISMDEQGLVDVESLRNVANEFRKQHGQLIPQEQSNEITGHGSEVTEIKQDVDITKLSSQQLIDMYAKQTKTK